MKGMRRTGGLIQPSLSRVDDCCLMTWTAVDGDSSCLLYLNGCSMCSKRLVDMCKKKEKGGPAKESNTCSEEQKESTFGLDRHRAGVLQVFGCTRPTCPKHR